jgi:integrase
VAKKKRQKGSGSVRFRKDIKRWVIDYYDKQHLRHQITTQCVSQADAIQELEKKRSLITLGLDKPKEENSIIISFKDYADQWYKRREAEFSVDDLAESTLINYRSILDIHLIPNFGSIPLDKITTKDIKDFVTKKKGGELKKKTVRNILGVLHQILLEAEDDKVIQISPYPKTRLLKKKKAEQIKDENGDKKLEHLELHQIPIFLNACPADYYCLFYTAIYAGPRRGELLGLQWKDIDFQNEQIHVRRSLYKGRVKSPKTETSKRTIDIGPTHVEILRKHRVEMIKAMFENGRQLTDDDFVFCLLDGKPINGDNLYHRIFRPIIKEIGLSITIHGLRHTYASILIGAGHNIKYISDQMGHTNIQTTLNIYSHLLKVVHKEAGKKTEDWINEKLAEGQKQVAVGDER